MILITEKRDLFSVPHGWYLAHCISADCAMGAGIAKEFSARYSGMRKYLKQNGVDISCPFSNVGTAAVYANVINLITKEKYNHKPTYESLRNSLRYVADWIIPKYGIDHIAMPKIGCGLDKLEWERVLEIINEVFEGMNLYILVCER